MFHTLVCGHGKYRRTRERRGDESSSIGKDARWTLASKSGRHACVRATFEMCLS